MKIITRAVLATMTLFFVTTSSVYAQTAKAVDTKTVKACVIGGMTMTGFWQEIAKRFEAKTDYKVEVVATGPKNKISPFFRRGEADLLVMHSSDSTTTLVVDGYGINMRPCAQNDLVILGPPSDPAGIKGMKDGVKAFRKIAESQSNYLDGFGLGKREVSHNMWKSNHMKPIGDWVMKDESNVNRDMLLYASKNKAYMVFGRMPVLFKKVNKGDLEIMVEGDPAMRRPYIVMEANPVMFPHTNHAGSKALSDFILSEEIQSFMAEFGKETGYPWFHPVWPYKEKI